MSEKEKVAILTNFMEFNPGYSLTGIVKDQAQMLARHGHEVHLFVNQKYHGEKFSEDVTLHKTIPFAHLKDYTKLSALTDDHKKTVEDTAKMLSEELQDFDIAFTHDFVFTGWFLPYGLGCKEASKNLPAIRWFHWIHSVPSSLRDWWMIKDYGPKHKLIFPNKTDRLRVAEQFRGEMKDVRTIHHIKDIRTWFDFDEDTWAFIDEHPNVLNSEIVCVYPASTDRLSAKRVDKVILLMSKIKQFGHSVCLVIANQWATGKARREDVAQYYKIAKRNGLVPYSEYIMTSIWKEKYATGIPKRILRELMLCSNLFIFPTREESFGLVAPEASLSGAVFMVLNKSLAMQLEVNGMHGLYFDFGSYNYAVNTPTENKYYRDMAFIILGRMKENEVIRHRTFVRRSYNMDYLYLREYAPVIAESLTW